MIRALASVALALLAGYPAYEGPIDVILVDLDDTAEVSWSLEGSDFAPCDGFVTNPEATVGCGEYGVGEPGEHTIRVRWNGAVVDKQVTIEKDHDYQANAEVEFEASEFVP